MKLKEILEGFKNEIGEMLISFGEKLTNSISEELAETKNQVKNVEQELELLKAEIQDLKKAPIQTVEQPAVEPKKTTPEAKKPIQIKGFTEKQDITLAKKFIDLRLHTRDFDNPIVKAGSLIATNKEFALTISKGDKYQDGIYLLGDSIINTGKDIDYVLSDYERVMKDFKLEKDTKKIDFNKEQIEKIVQASEYASKDNYSVSSVRIDTENGEGYIVATDTFRLLSHKFKTDENIKVSIPRDLVVKIKSEILKVDKMQLETDGDRHVIKYANRRVYFKQPAGAYPNFRSILDGIKVEKAELNIKDILTKDIISEIKSYQKLAKNQKSIVLETKDGAGTIRIFKNEAAAAKDYIKENLVHEIKLDKVKGFNNLKVGMNLNYLLKHIEFGLDNIKWTSQSAMVWDTKDNTTSIMMPVAMCD